MKPCFLCKMPGHTPMNCPHRMATDHVVIPATRRNIKNPLEFFFERQLRPVPLIKPTHVIPDRVSCSVSTLPATRVACLEFHPTKHNILLSGDKKGQVLVWAFTKVYGDTVYRKLHHAQVNNIRFNPANDDMVYAASLDGTLSYTDIETGISSSLLNLNSGQGPSSWKMLYGMDVNLEKGLVLVSDNFGFLHLVDVRSNGRTGDPILIHKQRIKVVGLDCNSAQPELLLSCGNDHFARIWDMRRLGAKASLADLTHNRAVNSAYFSLVSGTKIATTCQDNRLRIYDNILGDLDSPSREIVHSHHFNPQLTPFKAEWDPKDSSESIVVIGRFISENYDGCALHPIDFIDITTGQLVAQVMDPCTMAISPVNKLHPRDDVMASGSSRDICIWNRKEWFSDYEDDE